MQKVSLDRLPEKIRGAKKMILDLCLRAGSAGAHLGGCLSLAEILTVLYTRHLVFDPQNPLWEERDRFVLSKGHGGLAQYAAMHQAGILSDEELSTPILGEETMLYKHPQRNSQRGIEFTGGSLGQGLAFGLGEALALKLKGNDRSRVFVLLGDGELNEGSVWEALSVAGHQGYENLYLLVDVNGLQLDGFTKDIQRMDNLAARFESFGFAVLEADGHDPAAIDGVFSALPKGPAAILFQTKKGKGVSFAEDRYEWHARPLPKDLYQIALGDLGLEDA